MPSSTPRSVSAETTQAVERLVETQEFAFADVAADGRLITVNPFGRLCLDWEENRSVPEEVLLSLEGIPADGTAVLPIQLGGLTLTGIRRGMAEGWVVVGYDAPPASDQALDHGMFDDLVHHMPVATVRMTLDGVVLYANGAMEEATGHDGEEIRTAKFWNRVLLPAHVEAFDTALREAWRAGTARFEGVFRTRAGTVRSGRFFLYRGEGYHVEGVLMVEPETAGAALDARAATLLAAVEQGSDGFLLLDGDGVIRYANHRVREMLGIAQVDAWMSRPVDEAPGFDGACAEAIRLCLQARRAGRRVEGQFAASGGRSWTLSVAATPVIENGLVSGCGVTLRPVVDDEREGDPTTRFQDAATVLREVATSSPDLGVLLDAACRVLGEVSRADRVRVVVPADSDRPSVAALWSGEDLLPAAPEQDRETLYVIGNRAALYIGSDPSSEGSALAEMHPIDEACWVRIPSVHPDAFLAVERLPFRAEKRSAWSERERSQVQKLVDTVDVLCSWIANGARFQRLVHLLEDVTVEFHVTDDGERRFHAAGDGIRGLTGIPAARWIDGEAWVSGVVHPDDRPAVRAHDHVLRQGVGSTATYRIVCEDGTIRWIAERAHPAAGAGSAVGVLAVLSDVTERRASEAALAEALDAVSSATRRQTGLMATLSHEVRTPIGAIQGYAELLTRELAELEDQGTEVPTALREFVTAIEDRARRLTGLVQDLFDLSSIELGQAVVQRVPVTVHDVVTQCASRQAGRLREKGLTVRLQLDARNPRVLSDPRRLEQVFDGLLSNAVKFTESGTITVRTRAGKREVTVEVEDTGIGIAPEFQHRIFQAFTQEEEWRNRRYDGTGLGLSLVKRLLDLLGGRIEVESRKDAGSTFRVFLPTVRGPVSRGAVMPRAERG